MNSTVSSRTFRERALRAGVLLATACAALLVAGCNSPPSPAKAALTAAFDADNDRVGKDLLDTYAVSAFTPEILESDWRIESGDWTVKEGKLVGKFFTDDLPTSGTAKVGAPRAMAWLKKPLPREFEVSWKARGLRGANDLNVFFCSKGEKAMGYEIVFGGRGNQQSWLCQWLAADEFSSRQILDKIKPDSLRQGREYEFRVVRSEKGIFVYRDGILVMDRTERQPPLGEDDRSFAFSTWDNEVEFWDLKIDWKGAGDSAE